jgi:hypothetical protein
MWQRGSVKEKLAKKEREMHREDAKQIAETMLRTCGRTVLLRVRQTTSAPPMEMTLKPCLLKVKGEAAELLVAASAIADVAGLPAELFSVAARIVVDEIVWRVVSYAAVECGETVIAWRVQLAR